MSFLDKNWFQNDNCLKLGLLFAGDRVALMINNLGGLSVLELNIVAKEAIEYLGNYDRLLPLSIFFFIF